MEFLKRIKVKRVNDSLVVTDMPRKINEDKSIIFGEDGSIIFSINLIKYNKKLVPLLTSYLLNTRYKGFILNKFATEISTSNLQSITTEFDTYFKQNKDKYVIKGENDEYTFSKESFDTLRKDFSDYMSEKLDVEKENDLNEDYFGNSLWGYYGNAISQDYSYNDIKEKAELYNLKVQENVNKKGRLEGRYIVIGKLEDISAFLDDLDTGEYLLNEDNTANNELFKEWINKGVLRKIN